MKKIFAFILVMFNAFVIAGEQIPCKLKSNLIDTRDGGVSMQSSFNIELLGSNFAADPARPEGCEAKVTSTGKPNPRSIVLSTAAPSIANYSESIVISKGHVSNGALTFKRLSFLYGELDLVAQAHQGENALGELSGVLITGIWRTTDASGNVTEQEAFPALTPLNFNIHLIILMRGFND